MFCLKMRIHVFSILFAITFFSSLSAQADFNFLSFEQFQKLTHKEQKDYVTEVKKLLLNLTEETPISIWQRLFISQSIANENSRAEFNQRASNPNEELNRISLLQRATVLYKRGVQDHTAPATAQVIDENKQALILRMNEVKSKLTSSEQLRAYNEIRTEISKNFPDVGQKISAAQTSSAAKSILPDKATASKKPASSAIAKDQKTTSNQKKSSTDISTQAGSEPKKCIYAGFVITGSACQPYKKIPEDYQIEEIKADFFKCDNDDDIICNPLLFGFKQNCFKLETKEICHNKPVCIKRSVSATKNCTQQTETTDDLKRVLELWKNPKNKKTYDTFMNDLNQLCSSDNIVSEDVHKTCGVAAKRFNQIMAAQFPGHSRLQVKPRKNEPSAEAQSQK